MNAVKPKRRRTFEDELPDYVKKMTRPKKHLKLENVKNIEYSKNHDNMNVSVAFDQFFQEFFGIDAKEKFEFHKIVHDYPVPYTNVHKKFWEERLFLEERMKVCENDPNYIRYVMNCDSFSFNDKNDFQTVVHGVLHGITVMKLKLPNFHLGNGSYFKELKFNLKLFSKIMCNTPDGDLFKFILGFNFPPVSPSIKGFDEHGQVFALVSIYLKQLTDYYAFYEHCDNQKLQIESKDTPNFSVVQGKHFIGMIQIQNTIHTIVCSNQQQQENEDQTDGRVKHMLIKALNKCTSVMNEFIET